MISTPLDLEAIKARAEAAAALAEKWLALGPSCPSVWETVKVQSADVHVLAAALEAERAETARLRAERDELVSTVNQYEMHAMGFKLTKAQE